MNLIFYYFFRECRFFFGRSDYVIYLIVGYIEVYEKVILMNFLKFLYNLRGIWVFLSFEISKRFLFLFIF